MGLGEESTCQCKRDRFDPWSGKIPQATEQLSPGPKATEPNAAATEACIPQGPCSTVSEATAVRSLRPTTREWPPLATIK